jgi:hypothetical protein
MVRLIPRKHERVIEKKLPDETIIVNADTNELNSLSPSGQAIWDLIDGQRTVADIVDRICQDYGMRPDDPPGEEDEKPDSLGQVTFAEGESVVEQVRSYIEVLAANGLVNLIPADD